MIVIPQMYIRAGKVVLPEGASSPIFSEDPFGTAKAMKDAGAEAIYAVDLAVPPVGASQSIPLVKRICEELDISLYAGGGFRTIQAVESFIQAGAEIVALGPIAYQQPAFLEEACRRFPARIAVHIDVKGGHVTIPGYAVVTNKTALDYAEKFIGQGVRYIFYSEVGANGLVAEEHLERISSFCRAATARIFCTSEVLGMQDVESIARLSLSAPRLDALVLAKSLFEGRVDLRAAITMVNDIMLAGGDESTMTEI